MKFIILTLLFGLNSALSFDFGKYTVIDKTTKDILRAGRQKAMSDSSFNPGRLSVFGNSLSIEDEFLSNIPGSSLGTVPGTVDSTYARDYKCAGYGNTLWEAGNCVKYAVTSVKPETIIMMYGTNEAMGAPSNQVWNIWQARYAVLLDSLLEAGIIPIVSTIPPLFDSFDPAAIPVDSSTRNLNDSIRSIARQKHAVLVDYHQAFVDYTKGDIFNKKWWDDEYVHPSGECEPDTSNPSCGYGVRNAVCWSALNKVYRIIVDDGPPDTGAAYVSAKSQYMAPAGSPNAFMAAAFPGTSNIKISFNPHMRPLSIRVLNVHGKQLVTHSSFNQATALVSMETKAAGVYFVEALIQGKLHHRRVLLSRTAF